MKKGMLQFLQRAGSLWHEIGQKCNKRKVGGKDLFNDIGN